MTKKWAKKPRQKLVDNLSYFKKGTVLDLGGSDGVNDIYLAEKGFEVTNVDKDKRAIETFLKNARNKNLKVEGIVEDLTDYNINQKYDNIISFFTLHFLNKENAINLLNSVIKNTKKKGVNLLIGFTNKGGFKKYPAAKGKFYPSKDFLPEFYKNNNFDIIKYNTQMGPTRSGEKQEKFFILTRKP